MQAAALCFVPPIRTHATSSPSSSSSSLRSLPKLHNTIASRCFPIKAGPVANDTSTVDYSAMTSVFPAEACETLGGEACDPDIYPEVKLKPEARSTTTASEPVDREYIEYDEPKTVFPAEACDDLGGEFCEPDYQKGVY